LGDNPVNEISKALPRQSDRKGHFAALLYVEVPAFFRRLHESEPTAASLALEFLILTAARTGEVVGAKWSEIDLDEATWTIPASRMKAGREHRVPLAPHCIELLGKAKRLAAGSEFLFPGRSNDKPMSNMMLKIMGRLAVGYPYMVSGRRSAIGRRSAQHWPGCNAEHPVEKRVALPVAEPLRRRRRSDDVDEEDEPRLFAWRVITPGDESRLMSPISPTTTTPKCRLPRSCGVRPKSRRKPAAAAARACRMARKQNNARP
jgi:hypothetical protein